MPETIPLDSKEVMSLFAEYGGYWESSRKISAAVSWDALGMPEFGTDFAMQMLIDTKATGIFLTLYVLQVCLMVRTYGLAMHRP